MKNTLQTLDRGITALDLISRSDHGVTVAKIAEELEINRSVAYRIITTLENHGLVIRTDAGLIRLGATALMYSHRFQPQLRSAARPILEKLAQKTGATAFVSVAQGNDCHVIMARIDGYSLTRGHLQAGAVGVASPLKTLNSETALESCIGVVALDDLNPEKAIEAVKDAARQLADQLGI